METGKKRWSRWTECLRTFPSNKYNFTELLTKKGDYLLTVPLSKKERKKIMDAAYAWAWYWQYTIECTSYPAEEKDKYIVYIHLVKKYRERDYG